MGKKPELMFHINVMDFSHCRKGESLKDADGATLIKDCPADGIFAEVRTNGRHRFAVSVVGVGGISGIEPMEFEAALRGMLAALANHCNMPQDEGIVVPERMLQ